MYVYTYIYIYIFILYITYVYVFVNYWIRNAHIYVHMNTTDARRNTTRTTFIQKQHELHTHKRNTNNMIMNNTHTITTRTWTISCTHHIHTYMCIYIFYTKAIHMNITYIHISCIYIYIYIIFIIMYIDFF